MKYRTIVADPPWPIQWTGGNRKAGWSSGSTRVHKKRAFPYKTMPVAAIAAIPVTGIAADESVLFMWTLDRYLTNGDAARVVNAWGFEPINQLIIWTKNNWGLGQYLRPAHEVIVVARRGGAKLNPIGASTVQNWKQPYENGTRVHSAKPDGSYDLISSLSRGPYVELFARRQRLGWDTWGNEALNHVDLGGGA